MRPVRAIAFDATGGRLAAGTLSGVIRIWSGVSPTQSPELVKSWTAHSKAVNHLAFDSHGNLVSVGLDGQVRVWDTQHPRGARLVEDPASPFPGRRAQPWRHATGRCHRR